VCACSTNEYIYNKFGYIEEANAKKVLKEELWGTRRRSTYKTGLF
jgi:hypothetical protein